MNQINAMHDTILLAEALGMPELPGSTFGLEHLRGMEDRMLESFSPAKQGRWLGWAQAALVMSDIGVTLQDVKNINKANNLDEM